MSVQGPPDGAASPRTRSSDSIPAASSGATSQERVSRDPLPATAESALSIARGVRYLKEGAGRDGQPASLSLSRLDGQRVEVTLERDGKKTTFVLDLTRSDARQAYDDLTKFRTTRAELMAAKPSRSGVEKVAANSAQSAQPAAAKQADAEPAKSVKVKGSFKPKLEKKTDPDGTVSKTKGGEGSASLQAQNAKTKVDANGKAKVEISSTTKKDGQVSKTNKVEVGGNAVVTAPAGSGTVTVGAGAKLDRTDSKTTDKDGAVVASSKQQTVTVDGSVKVVGKDPRDNAGVSVKGTIGSKVEVDASGKKTVTDSRGLDVAANAAGHAKVGKEENLDWSASIDVHGASVEVKTPDGKVARTDEKSVNAQGSVALSDSTGPDQHSVKVSVKSAQSEKVETGPDGKSKVTDNRSLERAASASVSHTDGEKVIAASASVNRSDSSVSITGPEGKVVKSSQERTAIDGQVSVADKTGPQQGSVVVKGSAVLDSKVDADGKRTDNTDIKGSVAVSSTVKDGDRTIGNSVQVDAASSKNVVTNPDGSKKWSDSDSVGVVGSSSVSQGGNSVSSKVQVKAGESSSGDEKGVKQQKGSLSAQVDLTAAFKGDRKVGFTGAGSREYTLTLPASSPTAPALPLDHAAAQALPEGATFTLTGKGKLGINGEADGFKAGVSNERTLQIKVDRQGGSQVTATVDFDAKASQSAGFDRKFGDPKELNVLLSASASGNSARGRQDQFAFDLSNPAHQTAYDALLRGDLTPAQQLGIGKTLKSSEASGNEQKAKAGISFNKLGASVELARKDIDPSDDRIQKDPTRKAITDAAQKDGREVRWIERGGAWELGGGYDYGVSPGVAGFGFGFEAKKGMEWRSLGPKVDGEGGAPGLAMSADEAERMPAGSEFSIRGTGKLSGRAGVIGGWQAGGGGVTVSAGVSFDVSKGRVMDMNVRVKKLPDGQVEVRLDELKKDQSSAQFAARLGATVNGAELAASGGSILGALAKRPDVAEKLAGLQKSLSVEFKAGKSVSEEEGKGLVFTLDLSKPEARAAYERLVRGNPEQALDASGQADRGVHLRAHTELSAKQTDKEIGLKVGGKEIFGASDSRKDVTVQATIEEKSERLDESIADRKRSNIFGRRRHLSFDAVSLRTDRAPTGEKFMHLSYEETDRYTSRGELSERRALARSLGATPVKEERIQEEHGGGVVRWIAGAKNDHGKVTTKVDVYVTSEGIAKIRGAGRENWISAFGEAVNDVRGRTPAWNDPATSTRARELLDGYRSSKEGARDGFRKQYEREFGKDRFKADVKDYARASEFADALAKSSDDVNPAAWNRTFADLAQKMGFNFFDSLSAMNQLAGDSEVVVGRFSMQGRAVDIEMTSEGTVNKPQLSIEMPQSAEQARLGANR